MEGNEGMPISRRTALRTTAALSTVGFVGTQPALGDEHGHSKWAAKQEGNGWVEDQPGIETADLGWNFKFTKADGGMVYGNLNIVEKMDEGENRHFKLNFNRNPIEADGGEVFVHCDTDEVRVEAPGLWKKPKGKDEEVWVAAHFRGYNNPDYPNTVWYWVRKDGSYITNSEGRLDVYGDQFTTECYY